MAERRKTIQFNALYSELRRKKCAISFLLLKFQYNFKNTRKRKKVYFNFIMHTTLATITSKSGRSIMHVTVSCLIIHFGCNEIGFKTNVERAGKDR